MSNTHPHVEVARALTERLLRGDVEGVDALYHDDAVLWQNASDRVMEKRKMLKIIGFLTTAVKDLAYNDVRIQPTEQGFVQQHVLEGFAKDGTAVRAHACLVAIVRDGRIARLDEYIDSAQLAPLMK